MTLDDLGMIFKFVGGLGLFLYGMHIMADGLQKSAGDRVKRLMGFLTRNRLVAILVGAGITAIIQSSSATTVMVVGFVNAGMLTLTQAVGVIMGANIGTTITAWIVSLSEWGSVFKPEFLAPLVVGIGAFLLLFAGGERKKKIGEILTGFGILFIGLSFMSGAVTPYRDAPIFSNAFRILGKNPLLAVITGAAVTAVIQSSSASVGILQTLAMNGVVNWQSAVFIMMGQNIGTCVTAILSGAGAGKNARRASVIHLLFNVIGSVWFGIVMFFYFRFRPQMAAASIDSVEISVFHTVFNLITVLLILPLTDRLVALVTKLLPDQGEQEAAGVHEPHLYYIDEKMLSAPAIAVAQFKNEVVNMADIAMRNFSLALTIICTLDFSEISLFRKNEEELNYLNKELVRFLVRLSDEKLSARDHAYVSRAFHSVSDLERVGDYAENIVEYAESLKTLHEAFSEKAIREIRILKEEIEALFQHVMRAYVEEDLGELNLADKIEDRVDDMTNEMAQNHIRRLNERVCTPAVGAQYLSLASNAERVADHFINIANTIRETE